MDLEQLFQFSNKLTPQEREEIVDFVSKKFTGRGGTGERSIVMHEEHRQGSEPDIVEISQVVFVLYYASQQWRKVRRKRTVRKVLQEGK